MTVAEPVSKERLAEYCREKAIKWLAAYQNELVQRHYSDVEVFLLVEFEERLQGGYITLLTIESELASLYGGVNTDLRTLPELRSYYRDEVLAAAKVQFAA